jgi:hypothetical protein
MKISRNGLGFMSMLAAGLLLAGATVLMPSALTFGEETDGMILKNAEDLWAAQQKAAAANQPAASAPAAPAPPAAPIDAPSAPADSGGTTDAPSGLPSAGSGGYLNSTENASVGYMLIALGITLMGSGSLVWAYSRRTR